MFCIRHSAFRIALEYISETPLHLVTCLALSRLRSFHGTGTIVLVMSTAYEDPNEMYID